jgi:hypothetical protein
MDPSDLVRRLAAVQRRGAGTDAERRAARLLAAELRGLGRRGTSAARAARAVGWPALALGCVDAAGAVPRAGTRGDTPERVDPAALQAALEACLALVAALDADLRAGAGRPPVVPAAPAR